MRISIASRVVAVSMMNMIKQGSDVERGSVVPAAGPPQVVKTFGWHRLLWLALAVAGLADAPHAAASDGVESVAASAPSYRARVRGYAATLDGRVQLLAKELDLDPAQQGKVRALLLAQSQNVALLWNDTSVPAALRVSRTQLIEERTADQIRAVLNDDQRKKYIQPRQRVAPVGAPGGDVQDWMKSAQDQERAQAATAAVAAAAKGAE